MGAVTNAVSNALAAALFGIYYTAGREVTYTTDSGKVVPYWANRFRNAVQRAINEDRLVPWVEGLVEGGRTRGYEILRDADRLDLTAEALVVEQFSDVFPDEIVELAADRLAEDGYKRG